MKISYQEYVEIILIVFLFIVFQILCAHNLAFTFEAFDCACAIHGRHGGRGITRYHVMKTVGQISSRLNHMVPASFQGHYHSSPK